jgi:transcriptional regulator with XRE-family HTH domain
MTDKVGRPDTITPAQSRAARALVNISTRTLAALTGLSLSTINNFECGKAPLTSYTRATIREHLERQGVIFLEEHGQGVGVKLTPAAMNSRPEHRK